MRPAGALLAALALLGPLDAGAVAALGEPREVTQPDGRTLTVIERGDEWLSWHTTAAGYWVERAADRYWYYMHSATGDARVLSAVRADAPAPSFARRSPPRTQRAREIHRPHGPAGSHARGSLAIADTTLGGVPVTGKVLVILAEFGDRRGSTAVAEWRALLAGEVANYFAAASFGAVTLTAANETSQQANDGIVGWVEIGTNHPNTAANTGSANRDLTVAALHAADPFVRFADFDVDGNGRVTANELAVVVVVAGFERAFSGATPSVWGHKWSIVPQLLDGVWVGGYENGLGGYAQFGEIQGDHRATMGIFVHELGHLIWGLPDLYDIDGSSSGIGTFGVMGAGSWGQAPADPHPGITPVLPSAWMLHRLGWAAASRGPGAISLVASGSPAATGQDVIALAETPDPQQYFLLQNRAPLGYDRGLSRQLGAFQGGMLLLHVDDSRTNNASDTRRWVDVEAGDGTPLANSRGRATDLWIGMPGSGFDANGTPNSRLYGGADSGVVVSDISVPGEVLSATLGRDLTILEEAGLSGAAGNRLRFQVEVPAGIASARFVLDGGSGNADLYVRRGGRANFNSSDCVSKGPATAESCAFAHPQPGIYHAMVHGVSGFAGVRLSVSFADGVANEPPTAAFTSAVDGLSVAFDATASADAEGAIATYLWSFGDGSVGEGATLTHTYGGAGSYDVTLTVEDAAGASASVSDVVEVSEGSAQPMVLFEQSGLKRGAGASLRRTISLPDVATGEARRLQVVTRGGSGALELYVSIDSRPTSSAYDCRSAAARTVTQVCGVAVPAGARRALLLLRGVGGFEGVNLQALLANGSGPRAEFVAALSEGSRTVGFDAGDSAGDIVAYDWSFGDGSEATTQGALTSHTYAADGPYEVTLRVSDADGLIDSAQSVVPVGTPMPVTLLSEADLARSGGGALRRKVSLPAEPIAEVSVRLAGAGNADLYVRVGKKPSLKRFDCASRDATSEELCVLTAPGAGVLHVLLVGDQDFSAVALDIAYLPDW